MNLLLASVRYRLAEQVKCKSQPKIGSYSEVFNWLRLWGAWSHPLYSTLFICAQFVSRCCDALLQFGLLWNEEEFDNEEYQLAGKP